MPTRPQRNPNERTWTTIAFILVLAHVPGCRDSSSSDADRETLLARLPSPDLTDVEASVDAKLREVRAAAADEPGSADAWGRYGIVLEAHGFDESAVVCYDQAAGLDRNQVRWPYLAGRLLTTMDPAAAVPFFQRALDLDPGSALIRNVYCDALLQLGRDDEAEQQYQRALEHDHQARRAMLGLGEIALRRGELDQALVHFNQALDLDFFDREVHSKLARLHRRRGDDEAAAEEALLVRAYPNLAKVADPYAAAVTAEAVSAKALTARGLEEISAGRLDDAEQSFWLALKAKPDSVRNRVNLAGVLIRRQRIDEAVALLQTALAAAPDDPHVHNTWAVALLETGRIDAAGQHLRQAIAADPIHDEALVNLGRVLEAQGEPARAADAYVQAIVVNPVSVPAHENLASLMDRDGRAAEALRHWRAAAIYGRFHPVRTARFAMASAQIGQFGDAADALRRGLRLAPDDVPMTATLVTILATCPDAAHRNGSEAVRWARRLVARTGGRHIESLDLLASALAEQGDFPSARATCERALQLARAEGNAPLRASLESRLALYRANRPYHQPRAAAPGPNPPPGLE